MYKILYEDNDIIVCHKKAGIPVQSARIGQKDMVSILNNYLAESGRREENGLKYRRAEEIHVVHRLDQPVEGVIVFARNKKAAAELGRQIADGRMKKRYQAVVCVTQKGQELLGRAGRDSRGDSSENRGEKQTGDTLTKEKNSYLLVDYLAKDGKMNRSEVVAQNHREAKKAELSFSVSSVRNYASRAEKQYALVSIDLKTGRHHQIRVQMAHAGLPLYGDQKYHKSWQEYLLEQEENGQSGFSGSALHRKNPALALCSVLLMFVHPTTGRKMQFETRPTTEAFSVIFKEK